jgi:hypothetical protein
MMDGPITARGIFPGMDPYLEAPDIWPDFHDRLATAISSVLNTQLPAKYYARLEKRAELGIVMSAGIERRIVPDVSIIRRQVRDASVAYAVAPAAVLELPRQQATPTIDFRISSDPILHRFVEIRDSRRNHKLVTLIEIISPSNKLPGPDRRAYESKQMEILSSDANLIEIDLLRSGQRLLPYPELEAAVYDQAPDYLVLLNRSALREGYWMDFSLYPISLREPLPCILVPLTGDDPDVLLDLQLAFNQAYAGGPYARMIDYTADPEPPLDSEDAAWAGQLLAAASLR